MKNVKIEQHFLNLNETTGLIQSGKILVIAASDSFISKLPQGNWIGGSIPYFITDQGGLESDENAFVHVIHNSLNLKYSIYDKNTIKNIAKDSNGSGFTVLIMPFGSDVHSEYAEHAPSYESMFDSPIIGWISGSHLSDTNGKAKTVHGLSKHISSDHAVAVHVGIPEDQLVRVGIINPFKQGCGDIVTFSKTGMSTVEAMVNGDPVVFSDYLNTNNIDTKMPMVANYLGTGVNVSIQSIGENVTFYAPVFEGVEYRFADPIDNYLESFNKEILENPESKSSTFSVNCILNYLYSELEGKKTETLTGPITFGEVAYQLLNQTAAYLILE